MLLLPDTNSPLQIPPPLLLLLLRDSIDASLLLLEAWSGTFNVQLAVQCTTHKCAAKLEVVSRSAAPHNIFSSEGLTKEQICTMLSRTPWDKLKKSC